MNQAVSSVTAGEGNITSPAAGFTKCRYRQSPWSTKPAQ
jgi:hypothetical protein